MTAPWHLDAPPAELAGVSLEVQLSSGRISHAAPCFRPCHDSVRFDGWRFMRSTGEHVIAWREIPFPDAHFERVSYVWAG
jgi:hypothetical protein